MYLIISGVIFLGTIFVIYKMVSIDADVKA